MRDYLKEMQDHYTQVMSSESGEKKKVPATFCPSTWNEPCKLCDACKEILFHQDKHTAAKIEQAREINRKPKFYANIVLPSNPSEVLLFEYGKTIGDKLGIYEMDSNSEFKGFTNPRLGRNMIIVRYPNQDKRKTRYDVEPRLASSSLADLTILDRLYNLDDIPTILKSGVQPLYQSKLTAQRTELRWLPFWDWKNHPELASVFQVKYYIHYHISEDELAAINRGAMNPLDDQPNPPPPPQQGRIPEIRSASPAGGTGPSLPPTTPPPLQTPGPLARDNWWETIVSPNTPVGVTAPPTDWGAGQVASPIPTQSPTSTSPAHGVVPQGAKPGCFGTYDEGEPLCIERCASRGWLDLCKAEAEGQLAKRKQARGLYK